MNKYLSIAKQISEQNEANNDNEIKQIPYHPYVFMTAKFMNATRDFLINVKVHMHMLLFPARMAGVIEPEGVPSRSLVPQI